MQNEEDITADAEEEKEPSLVDTLYDKLGLPETLGYNLGNTHILRELSMELLKSGVISRDQLEGVLGRAEAAIDDIIQETYEIPGEVADPELVAECSKRTSEAAHARVTRIRERLEEN
jgi:hypothetical protein